MELQLLTLSEAAVDTSSTFVHTAAKTNITAAEGQVQINKGHFLAKALPILFYQMAAELTQWVLKQMQLYSQVSSAGIVTLKAGELDFDNATDANFDGVYEFSVTYTNFRRHRISD